MAKRETKKAEKVKIDKSEHVVEPIVHEVETDSGLTLTAEFKDEKWHVKPKQFMTDIVGPNLTEMKVIEEEVKPIVVSTSTFVNGDKVKLINSVTNKVIAMATSRKLADKLIAKNPNLKIV